METFSELLDLCEGNTPVTDGFPSQRPVTRSFHVFLDLHLNEQFSKHVGDLRRLWNGGKCVECISYVAER